MSSSSSITYITPQTLASWLSLSPPPSSSSAPPPTSSAPSSPSPSPATKTIAIIDVRDEDHIGGHILNSQHVPSQTHDVRMPELVRTLRGTKKVVFHCMLSQQRGPDAARRYVRERARMNGEEGQGKGEEAGEGQEVFILTGGFRVWAQLYGKNAELTEKYAVDIWEPEVEPIEW